VKSKKRDMTSLSNRVSIKEIERYISTHVDGVKPSLTELETYRRALQVRVSKSWPKLKDAIVFISDRPNYFFTRVSISLRRKGLRTILVTRWGVERKQKSFFDHVVVHDSVLNLRHLSKAVNCIFYVQSWIGWGFLPVYVRLLVGDQRVICNVNDLTTILLSNEEDYPLLGLSTEDFELDKLCTSIILEEFPLVTLAAYNQKIAERLGGDNIISFPCYPAPAFFVYKSKQLSEPIRLVFIGGIPPDNKPDRVFKDAKLQDIVNGLLEGPFHLTILNNPQLPRGGGIESRYPYFTALAGHNPMFNFQTGLPPWRLKRQAENFDYGLMVYYFDNLGINRLHYENILPTKFFTYMEMGLPVIVSDDMITVSRIVQENGLGIVISQQELKELDRIADNFRAEYCQFIDNIRAYRQRWNMDKMVGQGRGLATR